VGLLLCFTLCHFETKWESNFYFGTSYVFLHRLSVFVPEWPKREFVGFIGYILVDKNTSFSGHWLFKDTVIQSLFKVLLQNIYSSMERIIQGKICNILLKKGKILRQGRFWQLYRCQSRFFLMIVRMAQRKHLDASQCFHPVRIAYQTQTTRTLCSHSRSDAQQMWPIESTCSHKCQDANVVATNNGGVLHNCPDARVSCSDEL